MKIPQMLISWVKLDLVLYQNKDGNIETWDSLYIHLMAILGMYVRLDKPCDRHNDSTIKAYSSSNTYSINS